MHLRIGDQDSSLIDALRDSATNRVRPSASDSEPRGQSDAAPGVVVRLSPEARRLYERASLGPQSVAELSAHCGVSLGVARVLLEDLAATDHVQINEEAYASPYDHRLLKRVIDGLREFA